MEISVPILSRIKHELKTKQVGDLVGELGRAVLDEEGPEGWPEFLPFVLQCASSSSSLSSPAAASGAVTTNNCNGQSLSNGNPTTVLPETQTLADAGARATVVTGLRLMSSAAEHTAMAAAADPQAFQALVETLQRCLCSEGGKGAGADVRLEAVRALGSVVISCARPSDQAAFATCLPHLLQAIQGETLVPQTFGICKNCNSARWNRSKVPY